MAFILVLLFALNLITNEWLMCYKYDIGINNSAYNSIANALYCLE